MKVKRNRISNKFTVTVLSIALLFTQMAVISAGDTWPYKGEQAHGKNEPSVHGYTSEHIADWSPETDPYAEQLRSFVPLQKRNSAFTATQANPDLDPDMQMINVSGDYGNAFIENAPYTNKFAQYHFNYWQYVDLYSYWHGTATAYTPPEYYDELAQKDWQQKWFEFGMLNIPNPTYTDAAHMNGVLSLAGIFFSNNDRGQQTYKHMIVKDENGRFPVAEKMIEMADYFGFDGYFVNQEEMIPNVATEDIPQYKEFLKVLQEGTLSNGNKLYIQWYDSLNTSNGANQFARTFNDSNIDFLFDRTDEKTTSQSFFFDYGMSDSAITNARNYLEGINSEYGLDLNLYETGFAGIEAGRDRFRNTRNFAGKGVSLATLGADFVHAGLDEDMGPGWPADKRHDNDYQWMTTERERLWWSGPNQDPSNTTPITKDNKDIYINNQNNWGGIANQIAERSVISGSSFYSTFNTGHGLDYYRNGRIVGNGEWSNMSMQDILPTWQWWQEASETANRLEVDYDYGTNYTTDSTRYSYSHVNPYEGGSSLVVAGDLNEDVFLNLFKTDLIIEAGSQLNLALNTTKIADSTLRIGLTFKDEASVKEYVDVDLSDLTVSEWGTVSVDLSAFAGRELASVGLEFGAGAATIDGYQIHVGELSINGGTRLTAPSATNVSIQALHEDTKEAVVTWTKADYSDVKYYRVYANDTLMGAKYDETFYLKNIKDISGTISVAAVSHDGVEGERVAVPFNFTEFGVSNLTSMSNENGDLGVNWTGTGSTTIDVTVETLNVLSGEKITKTNSVSASANTTTFSGMPVDGTEYLITLRNGGNILSVSGVMIDVISEPYSEAFTDNGTLISLPQPRVKDWRYVHVYEDGVAKKFAVTYNLGLRESIIRGRSTKASLAFNSNAEEVYVVVEDYAGNLSEKTTIRQSVLNITLTSDKAVAKPGQNVQVNAKVLGYESDDTVTWSIENQASASTLVDANGLITIGADETATTIKVIATSNEDDTVFESIVITVNHSTEEPSEYIDLTLHSASNNGNNTNEAPEKAIDDDEATKWCYNSASGWIIVDLQDTYSVTDWMTLHGEFGDGQPGFNTKKFALEVYVGEDESGLNDQANWVEVDVVDNATEQAMRIERSIVPTEGRYFKLRIDEATVNQYTAIRIHDFKLKGALKEDVIVDKTELETLVNETASLDQEAYTEASWTAFKTAHDHAVEVVADASATQEAVNTALSQLTNAFEALEERVVLDYTALEEILAEVDGLDRSRYTESSWSALEEAVIIAKALLNNDMQTLSRAASTVTQQQINDAVASVRTAIDNLEEKEVVDKTKLIELVNESEKLNKVDYTEESWEPFRVALIHAREALANGVATQINIDTMYNLLSEAKVNLVPINKESVDTSKLSVLVNKAEALNKDDYIDASWKSLSDTLSHAKTVLLNPNATQKEVDDAYIALNGAINTLVYKATESLNTSNLSGLLAKVETLDKKNYSDEAWNDIQSLVAKAHDLLKNPATTQADIDAIADQLTNAINKTLDGKLPTTGMGPSIILSSSLVLIGVGIYLVTRKKKQEC